MYEDGLSSDSSTKNKKHTYIVTNTEGNMNYQLYSIMHNMKETCKTVRQRKTFLKLNYFCFAT